MLTAPLGRPAHDAEFFPLIVFVHVPKTGGSTVNRVLWSCSHRGRKNCHNLPAPEVLDLAHSSDWLSGHLGRDGFARTLNRFRRPIEYFATVREPMLQLLSHLNFQFEIYARGPLHYFQYKRIIREMSAEVRATDFSKASAIIALLLRRSGFLNQQARLVLGNDFAANPGSETARRLASYTFIATNENLPALYRAFGFAQLPKEMNELRENAAQKYYFDTAIFQSQEILDFLAQHHAHDFRLYECVRQMSWPAKERRPSRPAFPLVTADNYDEAAYLGINPDVADALKRHRTWRSGRDHFEAHGYAEHRRQVFMPRYEALTHKVHVPKLPQLPAN